MLESILFHGLLALLTAALAWAFPNKARQAHPELDAPAVQRMYAKANYYAVLGLCLWIPLCAWGLGGLLHQLASWNEASTIDTPYRISAVWQAWYCVAAIFAMGWSREAMEGAIRYFMGQRAVDVSNAISEKQYGFSVEGTWRFTRKLLSVIGILVFVLLSDYGIYVYDNRVEFNDWYSLFQKRAVPLEQLKSIEYERDVKREKAILPPDPVYILQFQDGRNWRSNFNDFRQVAPVMNALSRQTGIAIDTVFARD